MTIRNKATKRILALGVGAIFTGLSVIHVAGPVEAAQVQTAKAVTNKITFKKIANKKVAKGKKITVTPSIGKTGQVKIISKTLTVKKGGKVIAKNKNSVKLGSGNYKVTTTVKHQVKNAKNAWVSKTAQKTQTLKVSAMSVKESNISIARPMVAAKGWNNTQMNCLIKLWDRESGWNHNARNRSSGAHGIPQAYPGNKMRSAGADWRTNPKTQIKWGLGYIDGRYGTPCKAKAHSDRRGWY